MSHYKFAVIGLKLIAIYFAVSCVHLFSTAALQAVFVGKILETPGAPHMPGFSVIEALLSFIPAVAQLAAGILMFFLAEPLAEHLVPPYPIEEGKTACSFEEVQAIVFAAVGILILTNAFPGLGRAMASLYTLYGMPSSDRAIASDRFLGDWTYSVGVIAQAVVGLFLVLSPKGFRNLWRFLRTAGTRPRSETKD